LVKADTGIVRKDENAAVVFEIELDFVEAPVRTRLAQFVEVLELGAGDRHERGGLGVIGLIGHEGSSQVCMDEVRAGGEDMKDDRADQKGGFAKTRSGTNSAVVSVPCAL
jgi:hypothetical protein